MRTTNINLTKQRKIAMGYIELAQKVVNLDESRKVRYSSFLMTPNKLKALIYINLYKPAVVAEIHDNINYRTVESLAKNEFIVIRRMIDGDNDNAIVLTVKGKEYLQRLFFRNGTDDVRYYEHCDFKPMFKGAVEWKI